MTIAMQQRSQARGPNSRTMVAPFRSTSLLVMVPRIAIGLAPFTVVSQAGAPRRYARETAVTDLPGGETRSRTVNEGASMQTPSPVRARQQKLARIRLVARVQL